MMMTHSYYGGDFGGLARANHRSSTAAHYDRAVPYPNDYYVAPSQEIRSDYDVRLSGARARTRIHEQSPERPSNGSARRRIQVACSRCRRRKIKCTGDPGDGSGCSACRSAGAHRGTCNFIRVGSQPLALPGADPTNNNVTPAGQSATPYGSDTATSSYDPSQYQTHQRSTLPVLQTRAGYSEYNSFNTSPVDEYTYASSTYPRHLSSSQPYSTENFRTYTNGSVSAAATSSSMYYESGTPFSFGSLQAAGPFPSNPINRLPSLTAEALTPLNMGSLHSSLPTQTVQERRLPAPYTQAYQLPSCLTTETPQIRPLGSFSGPQNRPQISGIHSRSSMSWSANSSHTPTSCNSASSTLSVPHSHGLSIPSSRCSATSIMGEPILGYQFSATSSSPVVSPLPVPALPGSFSNSSSSSTTSTMLPPSNIRYSTGSLHLGLTALSGSSTDELSARPSSSREADPSLFSFSTGVDIPDQSTADHIRPSCVEDSKVQLSATPQHSYPPIRHPQPQHAVSVDGLRRRSSYEKRAATAHRMSVSNLNAHY